MLTVGLGYGERSLHQLWDAAGETDKPTTVCIHGFSFRMLIGTLFNCSAMLTNPASAGPHSPQRVDKTFPYGYSSGDVLRDFRGNDSMPSGGGEIREVVACSKSYATSGKWFERRN